MPAYELYLYDGRAFFALMTHHMFWDETLKTALAAFQRHHVPMRWNGRYAPHRYSIVVRDISGRTVHTELAF